MRFWPLLILLVPSVQAAGIRPLYDGEVEVWPSKLRTLEVPPRQGAARLRSSYSVLRGSEQVRLILVRLGEDGQRTPVAETAYGGAGALSHSLDPGESYRIVVENRREARTTALISLKTELVNGGALNRRPTVAARIWLIAGSITLFASIWMFAGIKLRRALQLRKTYESSWPFV